MNKSILFLLIAMLFASCARNEPQSRSEIDAEANIGKYAVVRVASAHEAGFVELELMKLFRGHGYKIIGGTEVSSGVPVMCIRYTYERLRTHYSITCTIVDDETSKALATIHAIGWDRDWYTGHTKPNQEKATQHFMDELSKVVPKRSATP